MEVNGKKFEWERLLEAESGRMLEKRRGGGMGWEHARERRGDGMGRC